MATIRLGLTHVLCDEDLAPQLVSWAISIAVATAWLILVNLTPPPSVPTPAPAVPTPIVDFTPGNRALPLSAPHVDQQHVRTVEGHGLPHALALDIAGAFVGAITERAVSKVVDLIPGVDAVQADVGASGNRGDKSTLATGSASVTPGLAKLGGNASRPSATVGQVQRGGGIDRAQVTMRQLPSVSAPPLGGDQVADAMQLGAFVRARMWQLQNCYERAGGTDLAGIVALRLTLGAAGSVRSAEIVRRTWSGPGAAAAESCLLEIARGWRVPSVSDGATVTIPISFTRGT